MKRILTYLLLFQICISNAQSIDTAQVKISLDSLIQINNGLVKARKLDLALETMQEAEAFCRSSLGIKVKHYADIQNKLGIIYYYKGEMLKVEEYYLKAKAIRENLFGKEHPDYASSLNNLGVLYKKMGQYERAEKMYLESKAIREKIFDSKHPKQLAAIINLANLYMEIAQYEKAEAMYLQSLKLAETEFGKEDSNYIVALNNLANLYSDMGRYREAETKYIAGIRLREKVYGATHPMYANTVGNLANLYLDLGLYEKAEPLYLKSLKLVKTSLGETHEDYTNILMNLGNLYREMGIYDKAEPIYQKCTELREKQFGADHHEHARSLNNLALLYWNMGMFEDAESNLIESKRIRENNFGSEHPTYIQSLQNLAGLYQSMKQFDKAQTIYDESIAIRAKQLGKNHPYYANSINNLGMMFMEMKQYDKAEKHLIDAKSIRERSLGKSHPSYFESLANLADLSWKMEAFNRAAKYYIECASVQRNLITSAQRHLSEQEMNNYIRSFKKSHDVLLSLTQRMKNEANLNNTSYDNSLYHKGFLLNSLNQSNRLIQKDSIAQDKYGILKSYGRLLAQEYAKPKSSRDSAKVKTLELKSNEIEKELGRRIAGFDDVSRQVGWQDVQAQLKSDELAIEFVHYHIFNPAETDSLMYAALVIDSEDKQVNFIPLFEQKVLEERLNLHEKRRSEYVNDLYSVEDRGAVVKGKPKQSLYELIWAKLEVHMVGKSVLYFSPSGLLHRLNLAAISIEDDLAMSDKYQLIQLTSTRQLVLKEEVNSSPQTALLYGGIEYDMDSLSLDRIRNESAENLYLASQVNFNSRNKETNLSAEPWRFLKYTKKEVQDIEKVLDAAEIQSKIMLGFTATEDYFKQLNESPSIIHFATHGFFFPDPSSYKKSVSGFSSDDKLEFKMSEHPMIRSGLILAAGNQTWLSKPLISGMEDGVLTAYEISQMNLSETDLVVLSACETGLGEISGNEGVYGLQRAFKIAGVRYMIMSLWQIPDRQTMEFMKCFYGHWLDKNNSIPAAFRQTQIEMRDRFLDPFAWAGFVLLQ